MFVLRKEPLLLSAVNDSVVRISPPSRWNGAPTTARKHRCSLMGVLFCLGRRTEGVQVVSGKPPASINVRQLGRKETHSGCMTRRLRRERWGCRPERGSTFFRCERKYQRKPAARRLREKALYCPFLKEGVRNVARSTFGLPTFTFVRARAHSFPLSKRARLFPSAAYRRSAPPQSAAGILIPCGLGRLPWLGGFAASRNEGLCSPAVGVGQAYPLRVGMTHVAWRFCSVKE